VGIEFVVANLVEPLVYGGSAGLSSVALIAAGETYSPARSPSPDTGRVLGIARERGCGRGDGARDLGSGCGRLVARCRRCHRLYAVKGKGTRQCNLTWRGVPE
jgi:hypothetical protein